MIYVMLFPAKNKPPIYFSLWERGSSQRISSAGMSKGTKESKSVLTVKSIQIMISHWKDSFFVWYIWCYLWCCLCFVILLMIYALGGTTMDKKNEVPDVSDSSDDENESPDSTRALNLWYDVIYDVVICFGDVIYDLCLWCDMFLEHKTRMIISLFSVFWCISGVFMMCLMWCAIFCVFSSDFKWFLSLFWSLSCAQRWQLMLMENEGMIWTLWCVVWCDVNYDVYYHFEWDVFLWCVLWHFMICCVSLDPYLKFI